MIGGPDSREPIWPVDLGHCRLWPMEGEDGPLLQELFDDLSDFESVFGARGDADAVSAFIALPQASATNPNSCSAAGETAP